MVKVINLADGVVQEWDDYAVKERGLPEYDSWRFLEDVSKEELAAHLAYALESGGQALSAKDES